MRFGFAYTSPVIYDGFMWLLSRGRSRRRVRRVASEIPRGASVVDLCAGTALLHRELKGKEVSYTALDINPTFVRALQERGIQARCADLRSADIPPADVVVMSSSLYYFFPSVEAMVKKMLAAARKKVVILESVQSLSDSKFQALARIARCAGTVNGVTPQFNFNAETFRRAMEGVSKPVRIESIEGGRDMLAVFEQGNES